MTQAPKVRESKVRSHSPTFPHFRRCPDYDPMWIRIALDNNDCTALAVAFRWGETPEGFDYWETQYWRMSDGDGLTIRAKQRLRRRMRYPSERSECSKET